VTILRLLTILSADHTPLINSHIEPEALSTGGTTMLVSPSSDPWRSLEWQSLGDVGGTSLFYPLLTTMPSRILFRAVQSRLYHETSLIICFFKRSQLASQTWRPAMSKPTHHNSPYQLRPLHLQNHNKASYSRLIYHLSSPLALTNFAIWSLHVLSVNDSQTS
jgi:hypothetical protein